MPQSNDTAVRKPRLVGMNHVALEVGDIEEALAFYGRIFQFTLRGKGRNNAFIDMGDQFVNLTLVPDQAAPGVEKRHIGFVVDDRSGRLERRYGPECVQSVGKRRVRQHRRLQWTAASDLRRDADDQFHNALLLQRFDVQFASRRPIERRNSLFSLFLCPRRAQ